MAALTQDNRRDVETLQHLLRIVNAFLSWLVADSPFVPQDIRGAFLEVLPTVQGRVSAAAADLATVNDTEHRIWRELDDAGMVGPPLRLKVAIWRRAAGAVTAPQPAMGFVGRALRPLVKLLNSWLGSLKAAFPPLELVKEYKEGVEVVIDEQHRGNPPPPNILDLR